MITQKFFGKLSDGREVFQYTISNPSASVSILNLGGIIQSLCVTDKDGKMTDVVLGYDTTEQCEENRGCYFGALIGRFGNRIGGASFTLNGKEYPLYANDGPNHLHGGKNGFNWKLWEVEQQGEDTLQLKLFSADGEEGYPGNLTVTVCIRWMDLH